MNCADLFAGLWKAPENPIEQRGMKASEWNGNYSGQKDLRLLAGNSEHNARPFDLEKIAEAPTASQLQRNMHVPVRMNACQCQTGSKRCFPERRVN